MPDEKILIIQIGNQILRRKSKVVKINIWKEKRIMNE